MPEEVTQSGGSLREGLRDGAREMREDMSRDKLEGRLNDAVDERPLVRHLIDLGVVVRALAIAAVLCLVVSLLLSPKLGALVLVLAFFGAWLALASRQYNRRRPTKAVGGEGDSESEPDAGGGE